MSGVHFTTLSPSSTSSRRRTPCVEGCCGPIEIVICVSSGRSTISNCGMVAVIKFRVSGFGVRVCVSKFEPRCFDFESRVLGRITRNPKPKTRNSSPLFQTVRFVTSQGKIFTQSVALPVIRQKNAAQIRMIVKDHTEQIKGLALVPIRGSPDSGHSRHVQVFFVQQNLQTQTLICPG